MPKSYLPERISSSNWRRCTSPFSISIQNAPKNATGSPRQRIRGARTKPASPLVSQKGHDGGRNADDQDHGAEHSVGMTQRIRFAGTAQHACDGEKTRNRVGGSTEPQNDL